MPHARNFQKIVELSKLKSVSTQTHVIDVILTMEKSNECINFFRVAKRANVSKSYLYHNQTIRTLIEDLHRKQDHRKKLTDPDEKIRLLQHKIEELEKTILKNQKDDSWESKYHKLLEENRKLKKQLETAYKF
jgi:TolA-binding protein